MEAVDSESTAPPPERLRVPRWGVARAVVRAALPFAPLAAVVVVLRLTGVFDGLEPGRFRELVASLGWWAPIGFVLAYGLGLLASVPGAVFVAGGVLSFGPVGGFVLSYIAGTLANLVCFALGRLGRRLRRGESEDEDPPPGGILAALRRTRTWAQLDRRPFLVVTLVRLLFPTTAVASFALAYARVRFGPYLAGSLLGLVPQLLITTLLFAWAFDGR
jgi:uncharacterized membrane protein YdjX (TVP38/TMEM64 family)